MFTKEEDLLFAIRYNQVRKVEISIGTILNVSSDDIYKSLITNKDCIDVGYATTLNFIYTLAKDGFYNTYSIKDLLNMIFAREE